MKHKTLRKVLATLVSIIVVGAIVATVVCMYQVWNLPDKRVIGIPLILGIFLLETICGLFMFSNKQYSDENKAFWLLIILALPVVGAIFWMFIGREKQKSYGKGSNSQTTLLSHLFKAKKSIKIYTNSFFISNDTIKALNYSYWKHIDIEIVLSIDKKKWKQKLLKYDINKYLESNIKVYFTNKEIEHNFICIDESEVLFSNSNFNFKNMYNNTRIYLAQDPSGYISLWNRDFTRSSLFEHSKKKLAWPIRLKNGIVNIFYPFF